LTNCAADRRGTALPAAEAEPNPSDFSLSPEPGADIEGFTAKVSDMLSLGS
jgi:hypothetical protein